MKTFRTASAVLALALLGAEARADYILTDLGAGYGFGINASGQVVGQNGAGQAFLYSNGTTTDLGTFGGPYSFALNINNSGQVVGWADTAGLQPGSNLPEVNAFLYSNGTMVNLTPGAVNAGAQGINSAGQVVGWYSNYGSMPNGTSLGPTQPFLYSNGTMTNLGSFPAGSVTFPVAINASGQVVGYTYQLGITGEQPFLIQNGSTTIFDISGAFVSINGNGQAVGLQYLSDTNSDAIYYSNGTFIDLGTLGGPNGAADGINSLGQIVGTAQTANGATHAFIYSDGEMTDLNSLIDPSLGWTLETARAINDSGQIVGWGTNASGQTDAFLLSSPAPAPEPGSLVLLSIGAATALGYAWRRRKASRPNCTALLAARVP